ncbi:MAG TPA: PEP-CTERM sorting domain-containing protein [Pirellulales bacterium]|nr:PEP-CTERM sorting domain-containing protein [Pirellulales bacterium]HWA98187.1 PEP-CTERM sorting domain-containing protein [Pirellulales bacterium]
MKTISTLGAVVVSIYFVAFGGNAYGQDALPSDELLITDLGVPIFDQLIAESGPGAVENSLTWSPGAVAPLPPVAAATVPGASIVILTEPANEPLDPGEIPITIIDKATGAQLTVSDVVISTLANQVQAPLQVTLVSDGDPELQQIIAGMQANGTPFTPLVETGQMQNLTPFLVPTQFPWTVGVRSDVNTPEPSTIVLAALGGFALFAWRRRR